MYPLTALFAPLTAALAFVVVIAAPRRAFVRTHARRTLHKKKKKQPSAPTHTDAPNKAAHALRPEGPVVVLLHRPHIRRRLLFGRFRVEHVDRVFVERVDVLLVDGHLRLDLARFALPRRHRAQRLGDGVVTLGTPRDIVDVRELHKLQW
jgi:hypothetical protein